MQHPLRVQHKELWCRWQTLSRGLVFFLLHYPLMAVVKLDTKEVTTGEIMAVAFKSFHVGMGYKVVKGEGTVRDKSIKELRLVVEGF